jgi:DNA-binding beta-propeller fold protein YncE
LRETDGAPLGTFPVGDGASGIVVAGANIWVANNGSSTVTVLRQIDGALLATVPVGRSPIGIGASVTLPAGLGIWVTSFATDSVALIDPRQLR